MERFFVVPVFAWKCQQASPGRVVDAQVDGSLTPMIGVTSAGTGGTMPMTATVLARGVVVVAGPDLDPTLGPGPDPGPGPGLVDTAIALTHAVVATAGAVADLHPIPDAGAGLAPKPVPSQGLQREVAPDLDLGLALRPGDGPSPDPAQDQSQPITRGAVVPVQQVQTEALAQQMTE